MTLAGWYGLFVIWSSLSFIAATVKTLSMHKANPMPITTVKYENAKPDTGFLNTFAMIFFLILLSGIVLVAAIANMQAMAGVFAWLDSQLA